MNFLLITENTDFKQFFINLSVSNQYDLVVIPEIEEYNSLDFNLIVIDATKNINNIIQYFKQIELSVFELKKILIILEDISFTDQFIFSGLNNFLFIPLSEKMVNLQFSKTKKDLEDLNIIINQCKKHETYAAKLEKTLQLMPDGVVIVDVNAIITYTNYQVEKLFGYSQKELIGKTIETLVPDKDTLKHVGYRNNYISNPKIRTMGSQLEVLGLKKDGSTFPADISLSPIIIEDELFIVSTIKNINQRKNIQLELKKSNEVANAANRAKSEFLANISHEFRTPLNAILGYSQILLRDRGLNHKQNEEVKIIKTSGEHLLGLISDILDVSKIEAGKMDLNPVEFNLTDFINGVAEIFKIRANEKGLNFHYEALTNSPYYVCSDEKKLKQILFNLLSNAIKFTPNGKIILKVSQNVDKIIFQVEDTGIGIETDKQIEIFQPFTQVSNSTLRAEGTGLGLSISQKLANILGSEIKIKSVTDKGSIFYFDVHLPLITNYNILPTLNEKIITTYQGERKKVLICDDKWVNRSLLISLLVPLDFIVFEAIDGFDCLTKCIKYQPDIIFLDLRMPNMDGFETAGKIRQTEFIKDTLIIAISASAFETDIKSSVESGCDDFIAKPFTQEKIFQILEKTLDIKWIYEDISKNKETKSSISIDYKIELLEEAIPTIVAEEIKGMARLGDIDALVSFLQILEEKGISYLPIIKHLQKLLVINMYKDQKLFTILLVDDNPNNLNLLLKNLRSDNYRLLVSKNGYEAIAITENILPDLILLDVLMPEIDGFETCIIIKSNERTKDIPIIFMTALTSTEHKIKGFELGAVDYITKPIQYEEVILRVKNHLLIYQLKNKLEEKNKQLEESLKKEIKLNKLKSRFIYMASHELKDPLSVIMMISSLLKKEIEPLNIDIDKKLSKIIKTTKSISHLLDDILLTTMIADEEELKFNPNFIDITAFCQEISDDYQLINPDYQILFESQDIYQLVYADEKLLIHILTNILGNCIKYSPKGSQVIFKVSKDNNKLLFFFKDNGIGISKVDQQTLFEEFKRGENVGNISGSGLGLSIVKKCLDLHNGQIIIESEEEKGTTTKIILEYINS